MKDERYAVAGGGLKLMFIGSLIAMFSFVPLIGGLLSLGGGITALIGLIKTTSADPGYKKAVTMLILQIVSVLGVAITAGMAVGGAIGGSGGLAAGGLILMVIVSILMFVFAFLQTYHVCNTTSSLLRAVGEENIAANGDLVWKLNGICYIISAIATVLAVFLTGLANLLSTLVTIIGLIASVLYVIFLYRSQQSMLS